MSPGGEHGPARRRRAPRRRDGDASGAVLDASLVTDAMSEARAGLNDQLEAFAANTMEYLKQERALLLDGVGVPDIRTDLEGRHVLIVVRGYHYKEDLQMLRSYIREFKPILIGVDGGADAIVDARHKPDLIVGDMDSVSDATLRCGAEVVVHAYRDGRAPGSERLADLGVEATEFAAAGTSEDVAMLLADDKGATLIFAVGTHTPRLIEFLDKGAPAWRARSSPPPVGGKLVDAKGVSRSTDRASPVVAPADDPRRSLRPGRRAVGIPRVPVFLQVVGAPSTMSGPPSEVSSLDRLPYHLVSIVSIFMPWRSGSSSGQARPGLDRWTRSRRSHPAPRGPDRPSPPSSTPPARADRPRRLHP